MSIFKNISPENLLTGDSIIIDTDSNIVLPPGIFTFKAFGSAYSSSSYSGKGSICIGTIKFEKYYNTIYTIINKSVSVKINGTQKKDTIMVAGSGGSEGLDYNRYLKGGDAGVIGTAGQSNGSSSITPGKGATQTAHGANGYYKSDYSNTASYLIYGGYGYYNGGYGRGYKNSSGCVYKCGGGGGSSFISGYNGCDALDENGKHTGQPIHYKGYKFYDTSVTNTNETYPHLEISVIRLFAINKFLLKQNNQYYTIKSEFYKDGQFQPVTLEGVTIPNNNDFVNNGFDDLSLLTQNMTIGTETFKPIDKLKTINDGKFDIVMKEIE